MFSKMKHGGILKIVLVIQIREDSILDQCKGSEKCMKSRDLGCYKETYNLHVNKNEFTHSCFF